jgi:hypothetical protein
MTQDPNDGAEQLSTQTLVTLMYARTDDAPASTVDVARTMVDGLRQRRQRRLVPVMSAVVVLALAGGVAVAMQPHPMTYDRSVPGASPPTKAPAAPDRFDPLRARLQVGWVPDGLMSEAPVFATGAQTHRWWDGSGRPGNELGRWVDVTIYAAQVQPPQLQFDTATTQPAPETQLTDAVWISGLAPSWTILAWRWAPNAWAVVQASESPSGGADKSLVTRVAESVTTDGDEPVRVPFSVANPPSGLALSRVDVPLGGAGVGDISLAMLEFRTRGQTPIDLSMQQPRDDYVLAYISFHPASYTTKETPNRTIDGRPASVQFGSSEWGTVTLYPTPTMEVGIVIQGSEARSLIDEPTAIALARSITVLGDLTDRSSWTTNPLSG